MRWINPKAVNHLHFVILRLAGSKLSTRGSGGLTGSRGGRALTSSAKATRRSASSSSVIRRGHSMLFKLGRQSTD
jgi:hypothetical protein